MIFIYSIKKLAGDFIYGPNYVTSEFLVRNVEELYALINNNLKEGQDIVIVEHLMKELRDIRTWDDVKDRLTRLSSFLRTWDKTINSIIMMFKDDAFYIPKSIAQKVILKFCLIKYKNEIVDIETDEEKRVFLALTPHNNGLKICYRFKS